MGPRSRPRPRPRARVQDILLLFRAGRMFLEGTRVVPDTAKGLVQVTRDEEGLIHVQWLNRSNTIVEDDQIVFPDEACFEKVNQSPDRVYILKFNSDSRKFFYWMQEPDAGGDAQICSAVNLCINQPSDEPEASAPVPVSERSDDTAEEMSSRAGNLHDQNLASELASEEATSAGPTSVVQLADLERILHNIQPVTAEDHDGGFGLADILKPDLVLPLMETLPLEQQLSSYLPEGSRTREDLIELLQSPPFRQQVDTFTHVLRTGQIDLSQFGIDPTKYKFTVLSFLEALDDTITRAGESRESEPPASSERCHESDPMDES